MKTTSDSLKLFSNAALGTLLVALCSIPIAHAGNVLVEILGIVLVCIMGAVTLFLFLQFRKNLRYELSLLSGIGIDQKWKIHLTQIKNRELEASNFVKALNQSSTEVPLNDLKGTDYGAALDELGAMVKSYRSGEQQTSWVQGGLARFAEMVKEGETTQEFSFNIIGELVKYLGANQGGIFLEDTDEEGERFLELTGCYAYDKHKFLNKRITPGEGILGECMLDHAFHYLKQLPKDYVTITSGLGEATARNVVITPLIFHDEFVGAIELASFQIFETYKIDFIKKVSESIAAEVASRKRLSSTEKLLHESQVLAENLKMKEEEMLQQMEELTSTQEEMKRNEAELNSLFTAINNTVASVEFDSYGVIQYANDIFLSLSGYKLNDIKGREYAHLFPASEKTKQQNLILWDNLKGGKHFAGEFRMMGRNHEEVFVTGTFNPILDSKGAMCKVIMIGHFTSDDKVKLMELGNIAAATKNSVLYVELNSDLDLKSANDRFLKVFGIKRMEIKNRNFASLVDGKYFDICKSKLLNSSGESFFDVNLPYKTNGDPVFYRTSFSIVRDKEGKLNKILVIMSDHVSENKVATFA